LSRYKFRLGQKSCKKILYSFLETANFTNRAAKLLSEEEYEKFQWFLVQYPEGGDLIPNGGGIRKIRLAAKGKGKRGGARVIYYLAVGKEKIFLLDIYAKNERADLTLPEFNKLRKIVQEWLNR
jgi:hypothetical protein